MSFSYSGDPQDSMLDECRFILGDTDEGSPMLQDEEIDYIISQAGSNDAMLKYLLFNQAATIFARAIKRSLGPQSEDPTSRLKFFEAQAKYYKDRLTAGGLSLPAFVGPKVFYKGMHSNPPFPKVRRRS